MLYEKKRPSLFKEADSKDGYVEISMTDEELVALIDVVQFGYRMYKLAATSLRSNGEIEKADKMDAKAAVAASAANMLTADGDPGWPKTETDIL
jgi:hypothetical protein